MLFYKPNIPIAVIEAKDNTHSLGDGMQQALGYAELLQVPFVFSSNGDGFLFHNDLAADGLTERELTLDEFPSPDTLWKAWARHRGLDDQQDELVTQDYFSDGSGKAPRYYQLLAINKTIEAIARGQHRILLVMATGTGKTYTAFQIIWRLWKSKAKKRILFLADRNILVDQTMTNDFKPFGSAMTKIRKRQANKPFEIYLSPYSLRQGIEDGFLAPYKVVRIDLDRDLAGWRPDKGMLDKHGHVIEDRIYNQKDFDKTLVLEERTRLVARKITEFLRETGRFDKTIVFCENIDHAERMRQALVNENPDLVQKDRRYVMRITGDNEEGKAELDNFIFPESTYPVIATTSKLMSTGVDAQTCKLIVLDQRIQSMTEFKQIIGRGTRINEDYGKYYFTIIDFKKPPNSLLIPILTAIPCRSMSPARGNPRCRPMNRTHHPNGQGILKPEMIPAPGAR